MDTNNNDKQKKRNKQSINKKYTPILYTKRHNKLNSDQYVRWHYLRSNTINQ